MVTAKNDTKDLLNRAYLEKSINSFLDEQYQTKKLSTEIYAKAKSNVLKNVLLWINDTVINKISPHTIDGIRDAVSEQRWGDICELYFDDISFGTAGIRGRAVLLSYNKKDSRDELVKFAKEGLDARILKGPNSINNIVLLLKSAGIAKYANDKNFKSIVIGFDSRVNGRMFAHSITQLFAAYGLKVYLFDEAVPYPELMYAVTYLEADIGAYISASHNDKRYNGYKFCRQGSQLEIKDRSEIYNKYILPIKTSDIKLCDLNDINKSLTFLGGAKSLKNVNYFDKKYARKIINIHKKHFEHCSQFIMDKKLLGIWAKKLKIGYAAFHGAGRIIVPKLLNDFGCKNLKIVNKMQDLNGLFPLFSITQQPDPGDVQTMNVAIKEFIKEHGAKAFNNLDLFIGTDPDADRVGLVVPVPKNQVSVYDGAQVLLSADEIWSLLLWYRLSKDSVNPKNNFDKKFAAYTHITTDVIGLLAKKYKIGYVKTWVGFTFLANSIQKVWFKEDITPKNNPLMIYDTYDMNSNRTWNIIACEQSNGFSILGNTPKTHFAFGENGHVKDKDGTLAALLLMELAAYAKSLNTSMIELLDKNVYLDKDIGLFVNDHEALPRYGQFEGLEGISIKIQLLKAAQDFATRFGTDKNISIAGVKVHDIQIYRTGKYDALHNWKGFPDEGIRFYFDEYSHLTFRPSGTSQSVRIHIQLRDITVNSQNLIEKKIVLRKKAREIIADFKKIIGVKE